MRTEQALLQHEEVQEELDALERTLKKKRAELHTNEEAIRQLGGEHQRMEEEVSEEGSCGLRVKSWRNSISSCILQ